MQKKAIQEMVSIIMIVESLIKTDIQLENILMSIIVC